MPACPVCGGHLTRSHRRPLQRLYYTDLFRCRGCDYEGGRLHPFLQNNVHFVFSRRTRCPRCGSLDVHRLEKRDRVDSLSKNLLSRVQRLVGAPINKCPACRLQYYDWRKPKPG